jgi:hypothetical protein
VSAGRQARRPVSEAKAPAEAGVRLQRSTGQTPRLPVSGALRPLARALVDLALALEHEDGEDES